MPTLGSLVGPGSAFLREQLALAVSLHMPFSDTLIERCEAVRDISQRMKEKKILGLMNLFIPSSLRASEKSNLAREQASQALSELLELG